MKKRLVPGAKAPAGPTLVFIASARYVWRFPEHVSLLLVLIELEKGGCTTNDNGRAPAVISAAHGRAAYATYAANNLEPRDDDADVAASGGSAACIESLQPPPSPPPLSPPSGIGLLATAGLTATAALTTASLLPRNDHDVTERCHAVACTLCVRARMQYVCVTGVYVHCLHSPM
jgi:hypothetical protein